MYREIDSLLEKSREGDNSSKEELINRLYPLIVSSIKRYYNRMDQYEDLISEGNIIVLECINSYDTNRGVYFLGYVKTMLKYNYLNKHKDRIHMSLNTPLEEESSEEWVDLLESQDDGPLEILIKSYEEDLLGEALEALTPRQRDIVVQFYIEGLSIGEIGKKLNVSYRTVVNTKTAALKKMKKLVKKVD